VVLVDFQNDFCRPARPGEDRAQTQANAEAAWRANDFGPRRPAWVCESFTHSRSLILPG
jgi:nicotinamidase-related amidase